MSQTDQLLEEKIFIDPSNLVEGALTLLIKIRPHWNLDSVIFKQFTDGITNHLIGCFPENEKESPILIRVHGKNTELFIDRQKEIRSLKLLNRHGLGPPVFCIFSNGLAYGYSAGSAIDDKMVKDVNISSCIARMMAKMHSIPVSKERDECYSDSEPCCFRLARRYLGFISDSLEDSINSRYMEKTPSVKDLLREVDCLEKLLRNVESPLVFCHNDLLLKNIVYNAKDSSVSFIDFEYADINYQAYDIANHFCEFAGLADFNPDLYPTEEFQFHWLRNYLSTWDQLMAENQISKVKRTVCNEDDFEERVKMLKEQVTKFSLLSHLFWGIWSILQARHSSIDFDYCGYAISRLSAYFRNKDRILSPNDELQLGCSSR